MILDAEEHMRILEGSGLNWTVLRAPIMGVDASGAAVLAPVPGHPDTMLSYDAVAALLVDELFAEWIGAAPFAAVR